MQVLFIANSSPLLNWGLAIFNLILCTIAIIFILHSNRISLIAILLKTFHPIGLYDIKLTLRLLFLQG